MSRKALKAGTTLTFNNRDYTINELMGTGATCLVYAASYDDDAGFKHIVRIKELYPYGLDIERREYNLIWNNDEEKNNSFSSFCDGYEKLMTNQQSNFVVRAFDMCEANGTKYIIMDANEGVTFDKDESTDIKEILTTVKLLAEVVGMYHTKGYLHLDIKPENFLVYPRPSEHIVLFDLDSVASAEDIKNGLVTGISYSKGWAAPEQLKMNLSKICPATDIYAIGAVLFYKLMGRKVNNDDKGVFADWSFDEEMFLKVNPKLKFYLKKIFKKTLSANVKRRYQTISELLPDLDAAIETARYNAPYVVSNFNPSQSVFVGRENELMLISKELRNNRVTFLSGLGGIGKTKLAEEFAFRCRNHFGTTVFLKYDRSMDNTIEEGDFSVENDAEISKRDALIRLLDEEDLIIIDNFDEIENIDDLNKFIDRQGIKASIIITTRITETALKDFNRTSITVETMPKTDAWKLFVSHNDISYSDDDKKAIYMIFKEIENHTLTVELVAKYLRKTAQKPCDLYEKLTEDGINAFSDASVVENKDGKSKKKTIEDHINTLFNLSSLTDSEKEMLYSLSLFGNIKISKELFLSWFSIEDKYDAFENLIDYGWIKEGQNKKIYFHSLVMDVVYNDLTKTGFVTKNVFCGLYDYVQLYSSFNYLQKKNVLHVVDKLLERLLKVKCNTDMAKCIIKCFDIDDPINWLGEKHLHIIDYFINYGSDDNSFDDVITSHLYRSKARVLFFSMINAKYEENVDMIMPDVIDCYKKSILRYNCAVDSMHNKLDYELAIIKDIQRNGEYISRLLNENLFDDLYKFMEELLKHYVDAIIETDVPIEIKQEACLKILEFLPDINGASKNEYLLPDSYCKKFYDEEKITHYQELYKKYGGNITCKDKDDISNISVDEFYLNILKKELFDYAGVMDINNANLFKEKFLQIDSLSDNKSKILAIYNHLEMVDSVIWNYQREYMHDELLTKILSDTDIDEIILYAEGILERCSGECVVESAMLYELLSNLSMYSNIRTWEQYAKKCDYKAIANHKCLTKDSYEHVSIWCDAGYSYKEIGNYSAAYDCYKKAELLSLTVHKEIDLEVKRRCIECACRMNENRMEEEELQEYLDEVVSMAEKNSGSFKYNEADSQVPKILEQLSLLSNHLCISEQYHLAEKVFLVMGYTLFNDSVSNLKIFFDSSNDDKELLLTESMRRYLAMSLVSLPDEIIRWCSEYLYYFNFFESNNNNIRCLCEDVIEQYGNADFNITE